MSKGQASKLQKKIHLLETELATIKGSRSFKLVRTAAVLKNKLKDDPKAFSKKLLKTLFADPRRLIRMVKGGELNTAVANAVQNRNAMYHSWIALHEPSDEDLAQQRRHSQQFTFKPVISIVTPVFDPPVDVLQDLLESVLGQTYPYFELCLGNFGKDAEVKKLLDDYAAQDSRVKLYAFAENKGIGENSNQLLKKVKGDFIGLLDHDDTLSHDALYENAKLLNEGDYDFIFSDKDMIDEKGNRYEPLFKPKLSHEMMLSANYLTHFDIMRTKVVREVGGWDSKTDGAQDWDLFLKIMHKTDKIAHIPKILYHWRVIATSTAMSIETKPYALAGQRNAVQKYLDAEGIAATPYHDKVELLLDWKSEAVDNKPLVIIHSHTLADTHRLAARFHKSVPKATLAVLHDGHLGEREQKMLRRQGTDLFITSFEGQLAKNLNETLKARGRQKTFVFVDDRVRLPKQFDYPSMIGWLSIKAVGAVGAKILNNRSDIVDAGSLLTPKGIVPLFHQVQSQYQGYLGNAQWVRNLHVVSRYFFAAKIEAVEKVDFFNEELDDNLSPVAMMIAMSRHYRLVYNPKIVGYCDEDPFAKFSQKALLPIVKETLKQEPGGIDRYNNPNLDPTNPMVLQAQQLQEQATTAGVIDQYQHDALILTQTFDLTQEEIKDNQRRNNEAAALKTPKTTGWFLPSFDGIYAGLNNIFSFANYLANEQNQETYFFIVTAAKDAKAERAMVLEKFPSLAKAHFMAITPDRIDKVPKLDIGICTQWATAYPLAKCKSVGRKCYFIQDNEPNFYPTGSIAALVGLTYRLGFFAVANTDGLLQMYKQKYGGRGVIVKSLVDLSAYQPPADRYKAPEKPYKVFFYARPNMPRNAFELGAAGLIELKRQLGDKVHIVAAGASWNPADYGLTGIIENVGKMTYAELPDFYRSLDAGMMFMYSGHPGVIASELMASGCPVVVNAYDDQTWNELYQNEKTCVITDPTASEIARNLRRCLEDVSLRRKVIDGGRAKVQNFYKGYEAALPKAFEAIKKG